MHLLGLPALLLGTTACREAGTGFGGDAQTARIASDGLWSAMNSRFDNVYRQPRYNLARIKLAHRALSPSKIINDTSIWTWSQGNERVITAMAGRQGEHYVIRTEPRLSFPAQPGDARHLIRLRQLDDDEFFWSTDVDFGIGRITAPQFAEVFAGMLRGASNGRVDNAVKANYRSTIPRGSAAFGRLFDVDTVRADARPDGSAMLTFVTRMNPEGVKPGFPALASYVEKYIKPARYHFTVTDRRGARWMELDARDYVLTFRMRSRDGHLVPIDGAARPMPDELTITGEAFAKVLVFNVGVTDLIGDMTFIHSEHERGWQFRFTRYPEWHLPPSAGIFLSSALKRPFEKGGLMFRIAVNDSMGPQTVITRHIEGAVKEGAIIRWLGNLSGTAMGDYVGPSEVDENRFLAEGFGALRADFSALFSSPMPIRKDGAETTSR